MRGSKAKRLRRLAREEAKRQGFPEYVQQDLYKAMKKVKRGAR